MPRSALDAARESGLVQEGSPLLVMLSGGADSVCLLDVACELGAEISALHVNYGLRAESDGDEAHCRELCAARGVQLTVQRALVPQGGNVQAHARDARYRLAEAATTGDYAAAHTASDQAETVLYRLATSPGRRALLGMEPRRGRLVRPLLGATREQTREHCRERGLAWREDASNDDPRFARARVRNELMPALLSISPGAEEAVAETARQLRDEAAVLDEVVGDAVAGLGGGPAVELAALSALGPALARLALRALAEGAAGEAFALSRSQADAVLGLGKKGGSASLDLGAGLQAVVEYGTVRFRREAGVVEQPDPVALAVPGSARFGEWEVDAAPGSGEVLLSARALEGALVVRGWRDGDRMRPVGLGGTKTLQDLFTDRKVPRALRRGLPLVCSGDEIAWVAGVALDERFAAQAGEIETVGLSARRT